MAVKAGTTAPLPESCRVPPEVLPQWDAWLSELGEAAVADRLARIRIMFHPAFEGKGNGAPNEQGCVTEIELSPGPVDPEAARGNGEATAEGPYLTNGPFATRIVQPPARKRWCILTLRARRKAAPERALRVVTFEDAAGQTVGNRPRLRHFRRLWNVLSWTITFVPAEAARYHLHLYGQVATGGADIELDFTPVPAFLAAILILLGSRRDLARILRLALGGDFRRMRTMLALTASRANPPVDYQEWLQCFGMWPTAPPDGAHQLPVISALVFHNVAAHSASVVATEASLAAQAVPVCSQVLAGPETANWRAVAGTLPGDYIALIQAGEILPPHASWFVASELQSLGRPGLAFGDEDRLGPDGVRRDPSFRPQPNRMLMLSGTQSRGVWFVRRDVLLSHPNGTDTGWAEALRLDLWLRRFEAGKEGGHRIPAILTQRRDDAEAAPASLLAELVNGHLERTGMKLRAAADFPLTVRCTSAARDKVSILVPSRLRTSLALRCISSILDDLGDRTYELTVGVSQLGPLDAVQSAAAARLAANPHARVDALPFRSFNFSQVCNALAARTMGPYILLLNDDVSVIRPGWLDEMLAVMGDPRVAVVGAKLLYPDRSVQHGGVIIGLSGLCDHAHRMLPAGKLDRSGRVALLQEMSAVTGACLLVRRSVYEALGGMDEAYPSAFNDVDFCLRVREAGHAVVYAPAAELVHHEMQTYGSHYAGDRAPFQSVEIARMRRRWAAYVVDDPFHNPNLDQTPGREWETAIPPRFVPGFKHAT